MPLLNKKSFWFSLICHFFVLFNQTATAQWQFNAFTDIGKNTVSEGLFVRQAGILSYSRGKNKLSGGSQIDLKSNRINHSPRLFAEYMREIAIRSRRHNISGFLLYNWFSNYVFERNWGFVLKSEENRFSYKVGTNFRTYALTLKAAKELGLNRSEKVHENFNLMYALTYFIKPMTSNWNAGISFRNMDYFLINQVTNPVFNLEFRYKTNEQSLLFLEAWYKSSGAFNLSVNPYGHFFRAGILWKQKE